MKAKTSNHHIIVRVTNIMVSLLRVWTASTSTTCIGVAPFQMVRWKAPAHNKDPQHCWSSSTPLRNREFQASLHVGHDALQFIYLFTVTLLFYIHVELAVFTFFLKKKHWGVGWVGLSVSRQSRRSSNIQYSPESKNIVCKCHNIWRPRPWELVECFHFHQTNLDVLCFQFIVNIYFELGTISIFNVND